MEHWAGHYGTKIAGPYITIQDARKQTIKSHYFAKKQKKAHPIKDKDEIYQDYDQESSTHGIARYIEERPVPTATFFVTTFNQGIGKKWFSQGKVRKVQLTR